MGNGARVICGLNLSFKSVPMFIFSVLAANYTMCSSWNNLVQAGFTCPQQSASQDMGMGGGGGGQAGSVGETGDGQDMWTLQRSAHYMRGRNKDQSAPDTPGSHGPCSPVPKHPHLTHIAPTLPRIKAAIDPGEKTGGDFCA